MITQSDLKKKITYYPLTGNFNWKQGKQHRAGTFRNIVIDSVQYRKSKLAWLYMTSVYPDLGVIFADSNDRNFKFLNLSLEIITDVVIVSGDGEYKITIDNNDLGTYNDFDTAFEVLRQCLKSMIKKS